MKKNILYIVWVVFLITACTDELGISRVSYGDECIDIEADFVFDGSGNYYVLPIENSGIVSGETEGGFLTLTQKGDKMVLYLEQNDDKQKRFGTVRIEMTDGRIMNYSIAQDTRDHASGNEINQGFIRNYGVGYSYDGFNGEKCAFNSVMSQVINMEVLKKVEQDENEELLRIDYRHASYYNTASGYSLAEYVHSANFEGSGSTDLLIYKGTVMKAMSVLEMARKKAFYVTTEYIVPRGERFLEVEKLKYYAKEYPNLLTHSFRKAVEKLAQNPSDVLAVDSFIVRFGSHIVLSSALGGKINLYVSASQESFDTKIQDSLFSSNTIPLFFKKMKSEGEGYNFTDVFNTSETQLEVVGGKTSILNNAVLNPSFENVQLTPQLLAEWESSIAYDEEDYTYNNVEMVDMEIYPIWELISDEEVAKYVQARAIGTASELCDLFGFQHFANTSFDASYSEVNCFMGGSLKSFKDPYVVNIISAGRYVATVVREWVPEIEPNQAVCVAYPIYNRSLDLTGGMCLYKGKVYKVAWCYNRFDIELLGEANADKFYLTSGMLDITQSKHAEYQPSHAVVGYEWPGSISIDGKIDNSNYYLTRKFLGNFYLAVGGGFTNLPNWHKQTSLPKDIDNYRTLINNNDPYKFSGIDLGQNGTDNLIGRMVMDSGYEFFWNNREVVYK